MNEPIHPRILKREPENEPLRLLGVEELDDLLPYVQEHIDPIASVDDEDEKFDDEDEEFDDEDEEFDDEDDEEFDDEDDDYLDEDDD